ncbi:CDP-alcohol phosphatidyltransferase family protein [bacterium]|nr:CDP-alcohol phosphatidyltransferase family protein [bacterium]
MNFKINEPIPERVVALYYKVLTPAISLFTRLGIHPNTFTTVGFLMGCIAAYLGARGWLRAASFVILLAGTMDSIDGRLARNSGKVTKFGALYDSILDRYSEVVYLFGMAFFFVKSGLYITSLGIAVAVGGSLMVSYVRARAEGLGFECTVGIMQRPLRLVLLGFGGLISVHVLVAAIWIVAVFSNITAIQRILHVWHCDQGNYANDCMKQKGTNDDAPDVKI